MLKTSFTCISYTKYGRNFILIWSSYNFPILKTTAVEENNWHDLLYNHPITIRYWKYRKKKPSNFLAYTQRNLFSQPSSHMYHWSWIRVLLIYKGTFCNVSLYFDTHPPFAWYGVLVCMCSTTYVLQSDSVSACLPGVIMPQKIWWWVC